MRVVPRLDLPAVAFFENHAPVWATDPTAIGLTAGRVADLTALTVAARAAFDAQQVAQEAARAATSAFNSAMEELRAAGSACVASVRAAAAAASDPVHVHGLALIPLPSAPGPIAAPGRPAGFTNELDVDGLRLAWRCKNPAGSVGTLYEVWRETFDAAGASGGNQFVAVTGEKSFLDATIPAGTAALFYTVTALRSTRRGEPATHTVRLGSRAGNMKVFRAAAA